MQIKTGRFMFFITRLTDNTNLAASIPPSEQQFNAARVNILLARPRFAELDIATRQRHHHHGTTAGFMRPIGNGPGSAEAEEEAARAGVAAM
jgi:Ras-related GTP-binding protein A/B